MAEKKKKPAKTSEKKKVVKAKSSTKSVKSKKQSKSSNPERLLTAEGWKRKRLKEMQ